MLCYYIIRHGSESVLCSSTQWNSDFHVETTSVILRSVRTYSGLMGSLSTDNQGWYFVLVWKWAQLQIFSRIYTSAIIVHTVRMYLYHYSYAMMSAMASPITSLPIVYSTFCSGADQREHQNSASQVFVRGIHRWPVNSPHKWPVTREMFPFDDVITIGWVTREVAA